MDMPPVSRESWELDLHQTLAEKEALDKIVSGLNVLMRNSEFGNLQLTYMKFASWQSDCNKLLGAMMEYEQVLLAYEQELQGEQI